MNSPRQRRFRGGIKKLRVRVLVAEPPPRIANGTNKGSPEALIELEPTQKLIVVEFLSGNWLVALTIEGPVVGLHVKHLIAAQTPRTRESAPDRPAPATN
jgi:hypothetical protein